MRRKYELIKYGRHLGFIKPANASLTLLSELKRLGYIVVISREYGDRRHVS